MAAIESPSGLSQLKRRVRPLMMLIALGFAAFAAWRLSERWQSTRVSLDLPFALLSILPLALGCALQGRAWIALVERMAGQQVPRGAALALYMDSQLARYTPGMVGLPLVRMAGAERLGVPARLIGSSLGLEMLSWTAVGGVCGFGSLLAAGGESGSALSALALGLVLGFGLIVLLLTTAARSRLPAVLVKLIAADAQGPLIPPQLPLLHVLYWMTWLAHGALLSRAFGAPWASALPSSGLYALATVGGFIALAAPAGVGVRESILSLGLAPALGAAPAVALAVASRAASLIADVSVWLLLRAAKTSPG